MQGNSDGNRRPMRSTVLGKSNGGDIMPIIPTPPLLSASLPLGYVSNPMTSSVCTSAPSMYEGGLLGDKSPPVSPSRFIPSRIVADVPIEYGLITFDCTYSNIMKISCNVTMRCPCDNMQTDMKFYLEIPNNKILIEQSGSVLEMTLGTMSEHKSLVVAVLKRDSNNIKRYYITPQRITYQGTKINMTFGEVKSLLGDTLWRISCSGLICVV